jgi:hypothetical protein
MNVSLTATSRRGPPVSIVPPARLLLGGSPHVVAPRPIMPENRWAAGAPHRRPGVRPAGRTEPRREP